nr:MAG TPA: hypothetical protein [Caudoviricetes sp.]
MATKTASWGSTHKTPDMLATGPKTRPEQEISEVLL